MSNFKKFLFSLVAISFLITACEPVEDTPLSDNQQDNYEKLVGTEYFLASVTAKNNSNPEIFNQREISLLLTSSNTFQGSYLETNTKELCGNYSATINWISSNSAKISNYRGRQTNCLVSNFYNIYEGDVLKFDFKKDSVTITANGDAWTAVFVAPGL